MEQTELTNNQRSSAEDRVDRLMQLQKLCEDGVVSAEERDRLRDEIVNRQSSTLGSMSPNAKRTWVIAGAIALVLALAVAIWAAVAGDDKAVIAAVEEPIAAEPVKDEEITAPASLMEYEDDYEEPSTITSAALPYGRWSKDVHSALLRIKGDNYDVHIRYYPGDRFEISTPNYGIAPLMFSLADVHGNKLDIKVSKTSVQGCGRIEVDDPESVMKVYEALEGEGLVVNISWLAQVKVIDEGHGLAELVSHHITKADPYTRHKQSLAGELPSKTPKAADRVYDLDPKDGMSDDEALELIIRAELGDQEAAKELGEGIIDALLEIF